MTTEAVHGLSCPRCGGMVPVPEGQVLVACPYCEQRSVIAANAEAGAEQGVRRYQAPLKVDAQAAAQALQSFLTGKFQVARDCARSARITETFLVHLPFWGVWSRGVAYAFGQVQVGSGDDRRWEPREKKTVRELLWNAPACEVGEFGVRQVSLERCPLQPFNPESLHRTGMVFEPVGSPENALEAARASFDQTIRDEVNMGRTSQLFTRLVRTRLGLVYYPLWVVRYTYRARSFQIVVDGVNGQVLYGKAPGSVGYRAGVLVGGMAAGAVMALDVPVLILSASSHSDEDAPLVIALGAFVIGLVMMFGAYRTFRHGEHYEYHRFGKPKSGSDTGMLGQLTSMAGLPKNLAGQLSDLQDIQRSLEKFK